MKAFALKRYSKSNGVDEVDVAVPQPRDGDVLVQVCAASVNPFDFEDSEWRTQISSAVQASADIG